MQPLAIDLFCGLGGWTDGLLALGYRVFGFDIEPHEYCEQRYPGQLVVQDVLTLHGSQFKDAALIVASPPCQEYSYMAMPWKLSKAKAEAIRGDATGAELERLNRLFNACFRIQKEASIAAGHHIPMVVENVRGAIPWVGRSRWNFGSFHLWGDVPALMPITSKHLKGFGGTWFHNAELGTINPNRNRIAPEGMKVPGFRFDGSGKSFQSAAVKVSGHLNIRDGHTHTRHLTNPREHAGIKNGNDWFGAGVDASLQRKHGSKSSGRKAASAMIAKIPLPLAKHIGRTYWPIAKEAEHATA